MTDVIAGLLIAQLEPILECLKYHWEYEFYARDDGERRWAICVRGAESNPEDIVRMNYTARSAYYMLTRYDVRPT